MRQSSLRLAMEKPMTSLHETSVQLGEIMTHFLRSAATSRHRTVFRVMHRYAFSIENILAFGLFNAAAIALISHKIIVIQLHQPLPNVGLFFASPCIFLFDFVVLWCLHRLLASPQAISRVVGATASIILTICSSAFASMFVQGNAELNWARSVEVVSTLRSLTLGII
jgi:hypothetical protein